MEVAAGEGIAALQRDRRVARALDAEGGVTIVLTVLVAGIDVDIVQRHVEGAVFDLVDDSDDVVGDVFGCVLEAFEHVLHGLGRVVPVIIVVIGVGDLKGWASVHELASQHRASALRAFGKGLAAGGESVTRLGVALRAGVATLRAGGGAVGLVFVFLVAGGVAGLVFVFLAAGDAVGLVLFRGIGLVFLAVVVRRAAALGVAEVDLVVVFVFVVFCFEHGQIGLGGRGCEGAAVRRVAAGGGIRWVRAAHDGDLVVLVVLCDAALLDMGAVSVFGDGDVTIAYVIVTRIRRCGYAGHHCGCQRQHRHPVGRGVGCVCRHPQRMPQNAHCKLAIRNHRNLL